MCTWVNENSWEMMKKIFPDAKPIKKCPKTVLCKECTCVQKYINGIDEKIDPTEDIVQFFSRYTLLRNLFLLWKVLKKG